MFSDNFCCPSNISISLRNDFGVAMSNGPALQATNGFSSKSEALGEMASFLLVKKRIRNQLLIGVMPSDPNQ
jgi:hypothetical protein